MKLIQKYFRMLLTLISPKLNVIIVEKIKYNRWVNFKNPENFTHKLLKLQVEQYNNNKDVRLCADKYCVREYVQKKGYGGLLNDVLGIYDKPEEIDWDDLPDKFVIKWNFGSGYNIICKDKSEFNIPKAIKQLNLWKKEKVYLEYAEMQYKGIEKKILIEKFLDTKNGKLPLDYKLYTFNGKVRAILLISDREEKFHKGAFFDTKWNYLGIPHRENGKSNYVKFSVLPECPISLNEMIEAAEKLAAPYPFVRVDFYEIDGKPIFGEMTFTPSDVHDVSQIDINGVSMDELLIV